MPPKVLLVNEDPQFIEALGRKLRQLHITVVTAESELEITPMAAEGEIDVVLLDIRYRGEEILQIMAGLKKENPAVEVILLSNEASINLAMEGIQSGAYDDIAEPFEVDVISGKIHEAWLHKKSTNKTAKRGKLALAFEKIMMAATFAEAGDFDTAKKIAHAAKPGRAKNKTIKK
ncbi:MAG: response regulator [Deltaproteobacteria bacterium]|nr:response regulator [Deltaproteobacteria bacterium]